MRGDDEDYTLSTKGRLVDRMRVILAGRAAEEVGPFPSLSPLHVQMPLPHSHCSSASFIKSSQTLTKWRPPSNCCETPGKGPPTRLTY